MNAKNHDDVIWKKSSLSGLNGNCVEVTTLGGGQVGVRDSKDLSGSVLTFTSGVWRTFVDGVRGGAFEL
ncbi:DUF397 domain-containing protein [Streptosporangium sp. NPDC023963]|uniref:DUF397 domain-containing protein n=1 Tax=Streptosporangium sp. NPDC023963 TaxID=3155608 RepID=UPI003424DAC5